MINLPMKMKIYRHSQKYMAKIIRTAHCNACQPHHLICFKNWTASMVMNIINSAIGLKSCVRDTHLKRLKILKNAKIMILQEVNEPLLNMAVSKAATLLGAYDMNVTDNIVWDYDYNGRLFSYMTDAIFVSTKSHWCIQRFAEQSYVPVICMRSRTHASIQALSTVMAIIEEFGTMECLNVGYLGPPHPVLNSYLLLCPMLGANLHFKCCCDKAKVSPLLLKASEDLTCLTDTEVKECCRREEVLHEACVVISGPSPKKEKLDDYKLTAGDIEMNTKNRWIYFHTCPRGQEVDNILFSHSNSRTFPAFNNMQYIAAALMANSIKQFTF